MSEELFREKSLERVKSPENLDDYIRVTNPGVWLLLVSAILLLAGACVWGAFGRIDSTAAVNVRAENGVAVCYVGEEISASVQEGMTVKFAGMEAVITEIRDLDMPGCRCALQTQTPVPDGTYEGEIVLESFRPLSFILN